jgi:hypothetical protein
MQKSISKTGCQVITHTTVTTITSKTTPATIHGDLRRVGENGGRKGDFPAL